MGISGIIKKPRHATIVPILIILFFFYFFPTITSLLTIGSIFGGDSLYKTYQIYHFDLGYQMINIYKSISNFFIPGAISPDSFGYFFTSFGIFEYGPTFTCYEYGCNKTIGIIETFFYLPEISLLYMLLIGIIPLLLGSLKFIKRDLY